MCLCVAKHSSKSHDIKTTSIAKVNSAKRSASSPNSPAWVLNLRRKIWLLLRVLEEQRRTSQKVTSLRDLWSPWARFLVSHGAPLEQVQRATPGRPGGRGGVKSDTGTFRQKHGLSDFTGLWLDFRLDRIRVKPSKNQSQVK